MSVLISNDNEIDGANSLEGKLIRFVNNFPSSEVVLCLQPYYGDFMVSRFVNFNWCWKIKNQRDCRWFGSADRLAIEFG